MLVKVVVVQALMGQPLTLEEKIHIFKHRPDFVCLPEYHLVESKSDDFHRAAIKWRLHLDYYRRLSEELSTCLVGGSIVEPSGNRLYNSSFVFNRGEEVAFYRKQYPMNRESERGISSGDRNSTFVVDGIRIGLMLCSDVFHHELYEQLGKEEVDIIFVPTTSPFRPDDTLSQKEDRDSKYFVNGARSSGSFVVKTCGVGSFFSGRLQGRSLIAAPWGVLSRVEARGEQERRILTETMDITELREFRAGFESRADKVHEISGNLV